MPSKEYWRRYYANNKEKCKEKYKRYAEKNPEKLSEFHKRYYQEHKEQIEAKRRIWRINKRLETLGVEIDEINKKISAGNEELEFLMEALQNRTGNRDEISAHIKDVEKELKAAKIKLEKRKDKQRCLMVEMDMICTADNTGKR